jgi:hypothetical protein
VVVPAPSSATLTPPDFRFTFDSRRATPSPGRLTLSHKQKFAPPNRRLVLARISPLRESIFQVLQ